MQSSQTRMLGKFVNLFNQEGGSFTIPTLLSIFFPKLSRGISEEQMLWIAIIVRFNAKQNIQLCRWTVKAMKLWQTSSNCLFWQSKSKNWVQTCWPRKQLPGKLWTKLPAITNCLHTRVNLVFVGWSISHKLCGWNSEFLQSANKTSWQVWNLKL